MASVDSGLHERVREPVGDGFPDPFGSQRIRDLLNRKVLASERHRAGVARQLGFSETEASALAQFARYGRLTPGRLAELLFLTSGGVTGLVGRLERAGHIEREPHPEDRRSTVLTATPETLAAAREAYEPLVSRLDECSAELTPEERRTIGRYLERIVTISEEEANNATRTAEEQQSDSTRGMPEPGLWA